MPHTNITTRIMQSRINGLVAENAELKRQNQEYSARVFSLKAHLDEARGIVREITPPSPEAFAALCADMAAEDEANGIFDHREPDYGLGGGEWIDPTTGADTWHS